MTTSGFVQNDGADLAFDREGQGPLLLLIVGGDGNSQRYASLSKLMSRQYSVVKYDRRAGFRSSGDANVDISLAQQARDAAAIIREMGDGPAYVFGNSGGASIAIKLTEDSPELVKGLVAHEPPVVGLLPDAEALTAHNRKVYDTYFSDGPAAAMKEFASDFVGMDSLMRNAPADQGDNMAHFLEHEFLAINTYIPDVEVLRGNGVPVITAVGKASADAYYARTAYSLAEELGCPCIEMSGHHVSYATDPQTFADELSEILTNLASRACG